MAGFWKNRRAVKLAPQLPSLLADQELSRSHQAELLSLGWTERSLGVFEELCRWQEPESILQASQQFANPIFQLFFEAELQGATRDEQRGLLQHCLALLECPVDLAEETDRLLSRFWIQISPHARFWSIFAATVSRVFPNQGLLVSDDQLARQIHQLRYVISAQQVEWVRRCYGGQGKTDREALVAYLATADVRDSWLEWLGLAPYDLVMTYELGESARFHNKRPRVEQGAIALPFPQKAINTTKLKVLVNWHSEFILSSQGELLSIWPATQLDGIINGASFNYSLGAGRRHLELDVLPVASHDPAYRRRAIRSGGYRSPNRRRWWHWPTKAAWEDSFFNKNGCFANQGQSCAEQVRTLARDLQAAILDQRQRRTDE